MKRVIAGMAATVALAAPSFAAADTTLNIVPWGAGEPGVPWATSPGVLPLETQALMYDRLTPLFRNVTDAELAPSPDGAGYFKSEALLDRERPVAGLDGERVGHRARPFQHADGDDPP